MFSQNVDDTLYEDSLCCELETGFVNNMVDVCRKYGIATDSSYMKPVLGDLKENYLFEIMPTPGCHLGVAFDPAGTSASSGSSGSSGLARVSSIAFNGDDYTTICRVVGNKVYLINRGPQPSTCQCQSCETPRTHNENPKFSVLSLSSPDLDSPDLESPDLDSFDLTPPTNEAKLEEVTLERRGIHFYQRNDHIHGLSIGGSGNVMRHDDGGLFRSWQSGNTIEICERGCPEPEFAFFTPVENFEHYFCFRDQYYFYINYQGQTLIYHAGSLSLCYTLPTATIDILGGKNLYVLSSGGMTIFN